MMGVIIEDGERLRHAGTLKGVEIIASKLG
jgi:hypothetical protein